MAAKRRYPPIAPRTDLPYSQLLQTQQNALYVRALLAYSRDGGPNPGSQGDFRRTRLAEESKA